METSATYNAQTKRTQITLPFAAISVNSLYRTYRGRTILSAKGRQWQAQAFIELTTAQFTYEEPVAVHIETWPSFRYDYDLDNTAKSVLDCLLKTKPAILKDDKLIYRLSMVKHGYDEDRPNGSVEIDLEPL